MSKPISKPMVTGIATIALVVGLTGCGSNDKSDKGSSSTTSSTKTSTTTASSTTSKAPSTPQASGAHPTIQDYIQQNHIQETPLQHGDPGPTIDLPVPDGWETNNELPQAPYGAIVYPGSAVPDNPPRILAIFEKLTGNVDPAKILELAPGELQNIDGWDGPSEGTQSTLSGFDAVQIGGGYTVDGKKGMIAQKTVVIPAQDGLYVLQLNAYSDESETDVLTTATDLVDNNTVITP